MNDYDIDTLIDKDRNCELKIDLFTNKNNNNNQDQAGIQLNNFKNLKVYDANLSPNGSKMSDDIKSSCDRENDNITSSLSFYEPNVQ